MGMNIDRNSSSVITNGNTIIQMYYYFNFIAKSSLCFIYAIINQLFN